MPPWANVAQYSYVYDNTSYSVSEASYSWSPIISSQYTGDSASRPAAALKCDEKDAEAILLVADPMPTHRLHAVTPP